MSLIVRRDKGSGRGFRLREFFYLCGVGCNNRGCFSVLMVKRFLLKILSIEMNKYYQLR